MHQEIKSNRVSDLRCAVPASPENTAHLHLAWNKVVRAADGTVILAVPRRGAAWGTQRPLHTYVHGRRSELFTGAPVVVGGRRLSQPRQRGLGRDAAGLGGRHRDGAPRATAQRGLHDSRLALDGSREKLYADRYVAARRDGALGLWPHRRGARKGLFVLGFNTPDSKGMDETALWRAVLDR